MTDARMKNSEQHPPAFGPRLVRSLRFLEGVRGWRRISGTLLSAKPDGAFQITNESGVFAGDLASYIDRQIYLYGDYEASYLRALRAFLPQARLRAALDIGANIGTHSVAFARFFASVHAFEPNPTLWPNIERHISINGLSNVKVHKLGLGEKDETLPFYITERDNLGLGTATTDQEYDVPLKQVGTIEVANSDAYLAAQAIGPIDFVKIDVQGMEEAVLRGLTKTLQAHQPFVWIEINAQSISQAGALSALAKLMPFPAKIYVFEHFSQGLRVKTRIVEATEAHLKPGDFLFAPVT
jgi:FkbM family methyltransferase